MLAIKTEHLTKIYKGSRKETKALEDLNLQVSPNQIYGFLGSNGAGKTTTINLLLGLTAPTAGTAWILEKQIGDIEIKQKIGFLPQSPYFYESFSSVELLNFYGKIFKIPRKERYKKIEELLDMVGLTDSRKIPLRKFSRGMLQRIGIAQTLINDPDLVFFDEPITGLDPVGRKEVMNTILNIKKQGRTVFFCSHVLHDVEMLCDSIGILDKGQLIVSGKLKDLLEAKEIEISVEKLDKKGLDMVRGKVDGFRIDGDIVTVTVNDIGQVSEIEDIMEANNGKRISVTSHKESLEEYFLKSIEKKGGEKA
ncbi:MAG: ABC transporter ATP-binding protein [bacterium]|nr:ABC transporter ATP-binding protein [bacterium]